MKFVVETPLPIEDQKKKLEALASELVTSHLASWRWRPDGALEVSFEEPSPAAGVSGVATPGAGSVSIEYDLPLRFRLFSGRIESGIRDKVQAAL